MTMTSFVYWYGRQYSIYQEEDKTRCQIRADSVEMSILNVPSRGPFDSESQHPYQRESLKRKPEVPMLDTKASQISIKASSHRNGQSMDCECSWMSKTVPFSNWRRKWQPTPVFFPGKPRRQRNVVGYRPRACNEVDMTEQLTRALVSDHSICLTTLFILV